MQDQLLRAILTNPADDTVRLAYADWLEENAGEVACEKCKGKGKLWFVRNPGCDTEEEYEDRCRACSGSGRVSSDNRDRAELIRLQIELSYNSCNSLPPDVVHLLQPECQGCNKRVKLQHQINFILARLRENKNWRIVGKSTNNGREWYLFERGFITKVEFPLATLLDLDKTRHLFSNHPISEVLLADRFPSYGRNLDDAQWILSEDYNLGGHLRYQDVIPAFLCGNKLGPKPSYFASPQAARDWLSQRCVNWGRTLVDLDTLPENV